MEYRIYNMLELQKKVAKFCKEYNLDVPLEFRLLDLVSEVVGELAKEILEGTNYGKENFKMNESTKLEIGDVMFALAALANQLNINLEKAVDEVLEKYRKRIEMEGKL